MRTFQQSVTLWYGVDVSDQDVQGIFEPLSAMRSMSDDEPWDATLWMYWMQSVSVSHEMHHAMVELSWRVALAFKERDAAQALSWLTWWENLHHTRAEYSKRTGCEEYILLTKLDFVPQHTPLQIEAWSSWLAQTARLRAAQGQDFVALVPFMAYYPWLNTIANACPDACSLMEDALETTFTDGPPAVVYAQQQWAVWCLRHRHPNDTYDSKSLMHRLFSEHSLLQLACFWYNGQKNHPSHLLPADIPKVWQRPLFAGSDITDAEIPEWQQAWVDAISTPNWSKRLSFWVAMVRVRRANCSPPWLARIVQEHPSEWRFFETMHSWMSQMPPFVEPVLNHENMDRFRAVSLDYEYNLARALWTMYNSDESIEVLALPSLD